MPFIDLKITEKLTEEKKEKLKSEFGKNINILHKPENYLMVGIADGYALYFAGKKLEKGAFVAVSLFGRTNPADCERMTSAICKILKDEVGVDGSSVYVTYQGISDWGFDGSNF